MNILDQWAVKHGVPFQAMWDLKQQLGMLESDITMKNLESKGESETRLQSRVRLEASKKGSRLWRNNIGAVTDEKGNFFRYGLANDSAKMNEVLKSSDLIGIRPLTIQPGHVGKKVGQFICREMKRGDWKWGGTKREQAQLNWINLINTLGGDARFCNEEGTI